MDIQTKLWIFALIGLAIFIPLLRLHRKLERLRIRTVISRAGGELLDARISSFRPTQLIKGHCYEVRFIDAEGIDRTMHCYFSNRGELCWVNESDK
jgi:hypothetical protein